MNPPDDDNVELRPMISSGHKDALTEITNLKEYLLNFQDMLEQLELSKDTKLLEKDITSLLDDLDDQTRLNSKVDNVRRPENSILNNAPRAPFTPFNASRLPFKKNLYPIEEEDDRNYDLSGGLRRVRTRKSRRMRLKSTRKRKHRKHKR
jgi:hypothetical protein